MKSTNIHLEWSAAKATGRFSTGVSLHSHTLHSRESLVFIYRIVKSIPVFRAVLTQGERRYKRVHGSELDLTRAWWTPPLAARDAWDLEYRQLADLGLTPLVSLTDHDDIEAPMSLQALDGSQPIPISVEWTVPYRGTFFHLGIHNLPAKQARIMMEELQDFTAQPDERVLLGLLSGIDSNPETLIVLNHPLWDETGIGTDAHRARAAELLADYRPYLHALEINGLRPWRENRDVIRLAAEIEKPVISGGDRHTLEPNTVLNLTNAAGFAEFADEVRSNSWSDVLVRSRYREPYALRLFQNMLDVFRTYEDHALGWRRWSDRIFYRFDDGTVGPVSQKWSRPPAFVEAFAACMRFAGQPALQQALRAAFAGTEKVAL